MFNEENEEDMYWSMIFFFWSGWITRRVFPEPKINTGILIGMFPIGTLIYPSLVCLETGPEILPLFSDIGVLF